MGVSVNSCCCFRLHTGGLILGWLGAIFSIYSTFKSVVSIIQLDDLVRDLVQNELIKQEDAGSVRTAFMAVFCVSLILNVLSVGCSLLLVAGTMKKNHRLILPWLILSAVSIGIVIVFFLLIFIGLFVLGVHVGVIVLFFGMIALCLSLQFYFYIVILSLYKDIRG